MTTVRNAAMFVQSLIKSVDFKVTNWYKQEETKMHRNKVCIFFDKVLVLWNPAFGFNLIQTIDSSILAEALVVFLSLSKPTARYLLFTGDNHIYPDSLFMNVLCQSMLHNLSKWNCIHVIQDDKQRTLTLKVWQTLWVPWPYYEASRAE